MTDTYGDLQSRIADEIMRSDLTTQIQYAILSAIKFYRGRKFWFNELRSDTFSTVSAQEFYSSSDLADIPNLILEGVIFSLSSTYRYPLRPATMDEIDEWSINSTAKSTCSHYCYYGKQIRLYPIPNGVYTVRLEATLRLTPDPLSSSSDTNAWMAEAEELIRIHSKIDLFENVIRDFEEANLLKPRLQMVLDTLEAESDRRISTGYLVPTQF